MKEMQELRDELSHYSNVVSSLIERSKDIAPLKQRRQPLPRPLRVTAVCSYKQASVSIKILYIIYAYLCFTCSNHFISNG